MLEYPASFFEALKMMKKLSADLRNANLQKNSDILYLWLLRRPISYQLFIFVREIWQPWNMIYRGEHYSNLQMYTKNIIM